MYAWQNVRPSDNQISSIQYSCRFGTNQDSSICFARWFVLVVFGRSYRRMEKKGRECIRVALNKRHRGTRVRALSHEISIQNALRALVPQDYAPGAMNLPLRGRPEIATSPGALPAPRRLLSRASIHRRYAGKGQTRRWLTFRRTSWKYDHVPPRVARTANFWRSFSRSPARSFVDVSTEMQGSSRGSIDAGDTENSQGVDSA